VEWGGRGNSSTARVERMKVVKSPTTKADAIFKFFVFSYFHAMLSLGGSSWKHSVFWFWVEA